MKYGQEYNSIDFLLGIGRAVTYFEDFRKLTEIEEYRQINGTTPQGWYDSFVQPYILNTSYDVAKQLSDGRIQWSSLNDIQKQRIREFVYRFSTVESNFAATNLNLVIPPSGTTDNFRNPGWRFYATEAKKYASYEPQAFYTLGVTGYNRFTFHDPNANTLIGQPGPWGTRFFVAENSRNNDVLLFYSSLEGVYPETHPDTGKRDRIFNSNSGFVNELISGSGVTQDWSIEKGSDNFDLLEYRVINYNLIDYTGVIGDAFWSINKDFVEQRVAAAITDILTHDGLINLGFNWYLDKKPENNSPFYDGVPFGTATVVIYRPYDKDHFYGRSSICGLLNPSRSNGVIQRSLSQTKTAKRYDISDFSITIHPKGIAEIQGVPHHPTSFMGIGAFVNYFPDSASYDPTEVANLRTPDYPIVSYPEYGASFPLSPTVESFQLDSEYDDKTKNKLDANSNYHESGYDHPSSTSKDQYIETIFYGNPDYGNFGRTKSDRVSLNYNPRTHGGKSFENGRYWTAQNKYTFYADELYDHNFYNPDFDYFNSSIKVIESAENEDKLFHNFDADVLPCNYAIKFGKIPTIHSWEAPVDQSGSGFHYIEAFNYQKQISRYSKFDINQKDSSFYSLTNSQAASRYGHLEFSKRYHTEASSPSSCTDTYHVFSTNASTGQISIRGYNEDTPWQNSLNLGLSQSIIDGIYYDSVISTIHGNSLVGYSKSYFNTGNIVYYGIDRIKNLNYSDGIYTWPNGPIIPSNEDFNKIWAALQYGRGSNSSKEYLYFRSVDSLISLYNPTYTDNTELNIYWQSQSHERGIIERRYKDYEYFFAILGYIDPTYTFNSKLYRVISMNNYPIFRMDNEKPYYTPPSKSLIGDIDSINDLNRYSLSLFGGIKFQNEIKNCHGEMGGGSALLQGTCQKHTRKAGAVPVLRWGLDPEAYEKVRRLYGDIPIAEMGTVALSNDKWYANPDAGSKDGSIYIPYDTSYTQDPPYCKLYGTPASVKHRNVGKAFTHPDICYSRGLTVSEAEASEFINFRVEFSGMKRLSRADKYGYTSNLDSDWFHYKGTPDRTEYEELFYNVSEEGSLFVGVKRKYKCERPAIHNNLVNADQYGDISRRQLYNYAPIGIGIGYLAIPQNQSPIPSEVLYHGLNRLPPELLGDNTIEYPTLRYEDAYKWQEDYVPWWDETQDLYRLKIRFPR